MTPACRPTFFLDVDNTLLDNDAVRKALDARLQEHVGDAGMAVFWRVYEEVRQDRDLIHMPTILERARGRDSRLAAAPLEEILYGLPFSQFRFDASLAVIEHLNRLGTTVITSDGDEYYQVAKVVGSGLREAVHGCWIGPHKEDVYGELAAQYPADRYVIVDDKPRIQRAAREHFGARACLVWVNFGHWAQHDSADDADIEVTDIGQLLGCSALDFCP